MNRPYAHEPFSWALAARFEDGQYIVVTSHFGAMRFRTWRTRAMKLGRIKEFAAVQARIVLGNGFGLTGTVILVFFLGLEALAPMIAPHQPWDTLRDAASKPDARK
jgi:hypothetical protein